LRPNGATGDLQAMKDARARGRALLKAERFELVNAVAGDGKVAMEVIWTGTLRDAAGPFAADQALRARLRCSWSFETTELSGSATTTALIPGKAR